MHFSVGGGTGSYDFAWPFTSVIVQELGK